jgi:hypothetical protein
MMPQMRPDIVTDEHLLFLDELRESGVTNMYGARPYLMDAFPTLNRNEAADVLEYWMRSFSERHGLSGSRKLGG